MKRVVTAIIMFIAVISLAICESVYTINVSENTKSKLESALKDYFNDNSDKADKKMKEAYEYWENSTPFLNIFLVHDNTDNIAEKISTAESTLKYDIEDFPIECEKAEKSIDVIIYSMLPYFDNIL